MKEENKKSLKKAIDKLPKYSPKDRLWYNLSDNLDRMQADAALYQAIDQLPTYTAPTETWINIEKELPARSRRIWPLLLAVAATIALLVGFGSPYLVGEFEQEIVHISHDNMRVTTSQFLHIPSTADRDSAFKTIIRAQKEASEKAKEILAELEKLDASKKRLKSRLSKFDINKHLEEKLDLLEKESIELQQAYLATI